MDHRDIVKGPFKTGPEVTKACLECHKDAAKDVMKTSHWTWESQPVTVGWRQEPVTVGKITVPYKAADGSMKSRDFTVYRTHHGPIVREADGKWVAFFSDKSGEYQMYMQPADGGVLPVKASAPLIARPGCVPTLIPGDPFKQRACPELHGRVLAASLRAATKGAAATTSGLRRASATVRAGSASTPPPGP